MTSGKELHRVLEAEVKTVVDVKPVTAEDAWALRLFSCIQCFRQLMHRGMTREVYLFGQLQVAIKVALQSTASHAALQEGHVAWTPCTYSCM
jgi:hypothetical protein